jgi:DNA-3-methyladenine glycosylase
MTTEHDDAPRPSMTADRPAAPLVPREFFDRTSLEVAPDVLGCVLEHETEAGLVAVRLTEVEAYTGPSDPASHSYRGRTKRNAVMFGPPGHAYVYFTYGMHFCVNLVCMPVGTPEAVLLRAGEVIEGEDLARVRRGVAGSSAGKNSARDLARGPARLCQALDIDMSQNGADVVDPSSPLRLRFGPEGNTTSRSGKTALIRTGPRVGIREAADRPWRFWLDGEPTVSVYRPAVPRRPKQPASAGGPGHRGPGPPQETERPPEPAE